MRRWWTAKEVQMLRANRHLSVRELAQVLDCSEGRIAAGRQFYGAGRLRYVRSRERANIAQRIRALYNQGRSDAEIARALGWKRSRAAYWRRSVLGLPAHGISSLRCRQRQAQSTRRRLRAEGCRSLIELRWLN